MPRSPPTIFTGNFKRKRTRNHSSPIMERQLIETARLKSQVRRHITPLIFFLLWKRFNERFHFLYTEMEISTLRSTYLLFMLGRLWRTQSQRLRLLWLLKLGSDCKLVTKSAWKWCFQMPYTSLMTIALLGPKLVRPSNPWYPDYFVLKNLSHFLGIPKFLPRFVVW